VLEQSRAGHVVRLSERSLPDPASIADAIETFMGTPYDPLTVDWGAFEAYSARASARGMAAALDEALDRFAAQRACPR
jgi:hypothetical protein